MIRSSIRSVSVCCVYVRARTAYAWTDYLLIAHYSDSLIMNLEVDKATSKDSYVDLSCLGPFILFGETIAPRNVLLVTVVNSTGR